MNRKHTLGLGLALAFALSTGWTSTNAQQPAPTETKGVTVKPVQAVDLGPEIEGMAGRQLRMRTVTLDPGAVFAVHNHKDRPGTVYVLQGKVTEHRGDAVKEYGPGDSWFENKETTHWLENKGSTPAVILPVDIFKQQ